MSPARHALSTLAALPASSLTALQALPGEVSGLALKDWAALVTRRFGAAAVAHVRDAAAVGPELLPDAPPKGIWYPVAIQLAITKATLELYLDGDLTALGALLEAETAGRLDRAKRRLLQLTVRPPLAFKATAKVYANLYRPGAAEAIVTGRSASVRWTGAAFQAEPLWQALQVVALGAMFTTLGYPAATIEIERVDTASFAIHARW